MATKNQQATPVDDRIKEFIAVRSLAPEFISRIADEMGLSTALDEARSDWASISSEQSVGLEKLLARLQAEAANAKSKSDAKPDLKIVGGKDTNAKAGASAPQEGEKTAEYAGGASDFGYDAGDAPAGAPQPDEGMVREHIERLVRPSISAQADALIEIGFSDRSPQQEIKGGKLFAITDGSEAAAFAVEKAREGRNVYIAPALRKPETNKLRRASKPDVLGGAWAWIDCDTPAQVEALSKISQAGVLLPTLVIRTGTIPGIRCQALFLLSEFASPADIERANTALRDLVGADNVQNADRVMRLAGSVSYPSAKKAALGYEVELTKLIVHKDAPAYRLDDFLAKASSASGKGGQQSARSSTSSGRKKKSRLGLTDDYPSSDEEILADLKEAVEGGQWHNGMLGAVAKLVSRGYPEFVIRKLVGPFCDAGEMDPDLEPFFRGAFAKGFDNRREDSGRAGSDTSDDKWGDEASTKKEPRQKIEAAPFVYLDPKNLPRRDFLYGTHLIRKFLSATIAPGGRGKSSLLMAEAIDMASGGKVFGIAKQKLRVWMWNGEDPHDEMMRKALATMKHYGVTEADVEGYLFLNSGRDSEIIIGVETKSGMVINQPVVDDMIETILTNKIDVVQIDPFVSSHRVSENDNTKIDAVAKTFGKIADKTNCAIDLSHHVRKGGPGVVTDISSDDARGAGAMLNAARASRVLNPAALKDAPFLVEAGEAFEPRLHFRVDDGKMNLAKPSSEARWFKLSSVSLDNGSKFQPGDEVGVPVRVEVKGVLDGVTERDLAAVQARLMKTPDGMMKDFRSPSWIGHLIGEVVGLDSKAPGMNAKIDKIVGVWVSNGALVEVTIPRKKDKREQVWLKCGNVE